LIGEIFPVQQIDWNWWEGHYGFGHDDNEKNDRDFLAKNPLKSFQGTLIMF
jgi:hypothetical protein